MSYYGEGPYLPVVSLSRSQKIRLGRGPGNTMVRQLDQGALTTLPQSGGLACVHYANLGDPWVRKDIQHHASIGAVLSVAAAGYTPQSDLFVVSGLGVTAGTGFALSVASGTLQSRFYGGQLAVSGKSVTPNAPSAFDRIDLVLIDNTGTVSIEQGAPGTAAPTYEVDTVATTGSPTGGTFTLQFSYGGYTYVTGAIAYNASAATVATALSNATSTNNGRALSGTLTGSGGPLGSGTVTITASAGFEGPISGQSLANNSLTGGTSPNVTFAQSVAGAGGAVRPLWPGGNSLALAEVFVPSTATSAANYTIDTVALTS